MEFLSESMEIGLESSWLIFQWNTQGVLFKINRNWSGENPYGIPFKINGNWFGELLVNFPMESLRNPFQYQWKLAWRALGQFPNEILKEFPSISMEIRLASSFSISLWNPQGILFNIKGNWSGELLVNFSMESLWNFLSITMKIGPERSLMEFPSNP